MQNTFRKPMKLFLGIWGDRCIVFRDQGTTDPPSPWGPHLLFTGQSLYRKSEAKCSGRWLFLLLCRAEQSLTKLDRLGFQCGSNPKKPR